MNNRNINKSTIKIIAYKKQTNKCLFLWFFFNNIKCFKIVVTRFELNKLWEIINNIISRKLYVIRIRQTSVLLKCNNKHEAIFFTKNIQNSESCKQLLWFMNYLWSSQNVNLIYLLIASLIISLTSIYMRLYYNNIECEYLNCRWNAIKCILNYNEIKTNIY